MEEFVKFFVVFVLCLPSLWCQQNVGNNVGYGLLECYNNSAIPGITIANERPPASMNILIEYIRKLEDANPTMSPAQLSYQIMQRLRQDGIARSDRVVDIRLAIPFASTRLERFKFQILLTSLLPNVEQSMENGDLTRLERCSLHYMISNTIDDIRRDNEATECSRSSRYTSRYRRDTETNEDIDNTELVNSDPVLGVLSSNLAGNVSQCPIELGVVYSQYGTIKAGDVLAGIAAGMNQQTLRNGLVDNRYAATLIGELCEASLYQATENVALGASGGWNSTIDPKYFFLQNNNNLQATDAELRGALDGLYIALRMSTLTSAFADLKMSQILDMYYSPYEKGVFDSSFKACNRNILYTEMTSSETMRSQLLNFMPVLKPAAISGTSLNNDSFEILANSGVAAFERFLPTMARSDLACTGISTIERVATDLLIFLDSGWSYRTVQPIISYVLNNIDVNKFGTRYTLYGGTSLRNLTTNGTRYLSDFYTQYNETVHRSESTGFDYIRVFEAVESFGYQKLNNNSYTAGESTIALFIPRTTLTDEQRNFVSQRKEVINRLLPDLNFLVLGSGSQADYSTIVTNTNKDVVILQESTTEETLKTYGQQLVTSIKDVPRAVVNPSCTSQYTGGTSTFSLTEYVEPQAFNYYRISPNYFATGGDTRNLRIREQGYGTINVCQSRDNSKPDNSSSTCQTISSADYTIDITSFCSSSVGSCSPIYLSVSGIGSNIRCRDAACRFPNDIQYTITLEGVGCANGSTLQTASILLVLLMYIFLKSS